MIKSEDIIRISKYFKKIHHTPGRLRVRVSSQIKNEAKDISMDDISSISKSIEGIDQLKINQLVGSLTIIYDKTIFSTTFWEDLLNQRNIEANQLRLNELAKEVNI